MSERQGPHPPHEWKARATPTTWVKGKATHLPATPTTWVKARATPTTWVKGKATHLPATPTTWVKARATPTTWVKGKATHLPATPTTWVKARATPTTWVKGKGHTPTSHNHHMSERQGHAPTSNNCRNKRVCHDKRVVTNIFVVTKHVFSCDRHNFVATKLFRKKHILLRQNLSCYKYLSRQKFFTTSLLLSRHTHVCRDKTRLLSRWNTSSVKHVFVVTKKGTCDSSRQWYQPHPPATNLWSANNAAIKHDTHSIGGCHGVQTGSSPEGVVQLEPWTCIYRSIVVWTCIYRPMVVWTSIYRSIVVWTCIYRSMVVWTCIYRSMVVWTCIYRSTVVWTCIYRSMVVWTCIYRSMVVWTCIYRSMVMWTCIYRSMVVAPLRTAVETLSNGVVH